MKKKLLLTLLLVPGLLLAQSIDDDDTVAFARLDDNVTRLEKIQVELAQNTGETISLRNDLFILLSDRAKIAKDSSDLLVERFLQKRIPPTDPLVEKKLTLIHSLLYKLSQVQRSTDMGLYPQMRKDLENLKKALLSPILKINQTPRLKSNSKNPPLTPREMPQD